MKKALMLTVVLLIASTLWGQQTVRVVSTTGKVEYRPAAGGSGPSAAAWRPVEPGMQLPLGASISTGFNARAVVEFGAATLSIDPVTRIELTTLVEREGGVDSELFLQVGRVRAQVRSAAGLEQNFQLRSTQSTASVRGTDFVFDGVNVVVLSGLVQMSNRRNQAALVSAGERTSVGSGDDRPENPGEARESIMIVVPYVPSGSGEIPVGIDVDATPTTGAIEFDVFVQ